MIVKRAAWSLAAVLVTALSVYLILTPTMLRSLRATLPAIHPLRVALVLTLTPVINLVRGARFSLALGTRAPGASWRMFRISAMLVFLNYMLPFKTGELSFPVLVRKNFDIGYATSLGVLVYSRVMDLLSVLALGGLVLTVTPHMPLASLDRLALPVAFVATLGLVTAPFAVNKVHGVGQSAVRNIRVAALMNRLSEGCRSVATPRKHAEYLGLTLGIWALQAACADLTMLAMGAQARPLHGVLASTAASVTFALPVSGVAGIGPMQAAWALALTVLGWTWEAAIANALLAHAIMVTSSALLSLASVLFPPSQAAHASRAPT